MSALLEISDLGKRYGSTIALTGVSLEISQAAAVGLVGKNGAGKTTLLSLLSGALLPNTGTIRILGETPQSIATTGLLNVLPQDATFKKGVPVDMQLRLFARLQGMDKVRASTAVSALLDELDDASFASRPPETLSYGQRKRLGIVQAFLGQPELVILDEPTAGLDPVVANDVRQLIRKLSGNSAFIISSHNLYEIEDICSSVIILDKGHLLANTTLAELAMRQNRLYLTLDNKPEPGLLQELKDIKGVISLSLDPLNQEKIIIDFGDNPAQSLHLDIQKVVMNSGYVITEFSRGKALIDGMMDLVGSR